MTGPKRVLTPRERHQARVAGLFDEWVRTLPATGGTEVQDPNLAGRMAKAERIAEALEQQIADGPAEGDGVSSAP